MQPPTAQKQHTNDSRWLSIPSNDAISVEHPCVVKNVDKAIEMIGGGAAVSQVVEEHSNKTFSLSFRPQDPSSRTILANKKHANNVLLEISVPRRTGRKRKRGSNEPWIEDLTAELPKKDCTYLVEAMRDNEDSYTVSAISGISTIHMWRNMPDFVYSTSQAKVLQDVKSKILSQHYPTIKDFDLPRTYGLEDTTTLPPPVWSNQSIPNNYTYRQNPSVKVTNDPLTGKAVVRNTQTTSKIYSYQVQWDTPEYPKTAMPELTPLEGQSKIFKDTVAALQDLFDQRPIWTRRALLNRLDSSLSSFNVVRFCLAYVAFAIRSGPWRDTYIRLGVDPRTDPKYRFYQSIMLQLVPKTNVRRAAPVESSRRIYDEKGQKHVTNQAETPKDPNARENNTPQQTEREKILENRYTYSRFWSRSNDPKSHIFDGLSPLPPDGKVWQLCDITDPQLTALRDISDVQIRATCENRYFGWYLNGTNAKMRVALKAKTDALMDGKPLDDAALEGFLKLPEQVGFGRHEQRLQNHDMLPATTTEGLAPPDTTPDQLIQAAQDLTTRGEALSVYLSENATRQQLEWAALYRAFARTEPGQKPAAGGAGHGRLTKSKPTVRKSYRPRAKKKAAKSQIQAQEGEATGAGSQNAPVDVDNIDDEESLAMYEEGPELEEGEEVLPSIELRGFDMDENDDSDLGLDIDPDIKLEDLEDGFGEAEQEFDGVIDPDLERMDYAAPDAVQRVRLS